MQLRLNTLASLLLFTFLLTNVSAQVFPVQTVVNHTLPHYNYLSQLADQNNHLQIITTLTDFNAQPVQARLRFRIEGPGYEINTNQSEVVGTPFLLEPGVPLVHSGTDLQQYFFEANLEWSPSGLNLNDLPFGGVTVCVDVIKDGVNQEVLSTNNCTFFEIIEAQPPFLTQPTCGANMDTLNMFPQFFWTPPPGFTPSPGASLNYRLIIYEQLDNVNYSQFLSSPLLGPGPGFVYESVVMGEMTQVPAFEIPFQNGKDYIWWVRAELTDDQSQMPIQMFVNNGLSEPCTFTYGESVSLEETLADGLYIDLFAEPQSQLKGRAYWEVNDNSQGQGLSSFEKYILEYRKKNTSQWHNDTVTGLEKVIFQLSPETTYEVRISGQIGTFISDPTDVVEFTTLAPIDYACGDQQMPYVPTQLIENENVLAGDQVQIGQFLMTLTEVQSTGSPGRYEGKGTIPIQFLADARAKVRFDDILIDEDFVVRDGRVDVITDGLDNWLNEQYMQFIDPIYVNGTIDSAYVDTVAGVAWVTIDGVDTSFTFDPPDYPIILNDESGYQWTIWPDGTVTVQGYLDPSEQWAVEADEVAVFVQNDSETFGFDAKEHMEWHEQYDVTQLSDTSYYFVPNKSIGKNVSDLVNVQLPQVGGTPVFKLDDQTDLSSTPIAGQPGDTVITHEITIPGISQTGEHTIYAYNGVNRVGKLNIYVYGEKERDVVIVPLTNSSLDSNALANALQQTLGEANLHVNFSIASQWNDTFYTSSKNIQVPEEVGLMSKYSDDMRGLRDAYFNDSTITKQSGAYYLFLVPGFDDPTVDGYMVRGRGLGFVEAGSDYLTIAHELGHGMGALEHTWKNNGPAKGSTNNLMDYSVGKPGYPNLTKAQWKELRDIDVAPSIWDEEEDAANIIASINDYDIPDALKNPDGSITFLSPAIKPITLKGEISQLIFETYSYFPSSGNYEDYDSPPPFGSLISFTIDGVKYLADVDMNGDFLGYGGIVDSTFTYYTEDYSNANVGENAVVGLPAFIFGQFGLGLTKCDYVIETTALGNKGEGQTKGNEDIVNQYTDNLNADDTHILVADVDNRDYTEELLIYSDLIDVIDEHNFIEYLPSLSNNASGHYIGHSAYWAFKLLKLIHDNKDYYSCATSLRHRLADYFEDQMSGMAFAQAEEEYWENENTEPLIIDGVRFEVEEYTPGNDGSFELKTSVINGSSAMHKSTFMNYYNQRDVVMVKQNLLLQRFFRRYEFLFTKRGDLNMSFIDGLRINLNKGINAKGYINSEYEKSIKCVFYGLTYPQREEIMDYLYQQMPASFVNNTARAEIILWVLQTAPFDQYSQLKSWLSKTGFKMFEELADEVSLNNGKFYQASHIGNNVNITNYTSFVAKKYGQKDRARIMLGRIAKHENAHIIQLHNSPLGVGSNIVKVVPLFAYTLIDDGDYVTSDYDPGTNKYTFSVHLESFDQYYDKVLNPFDLVLVKVHDNISSSVVTLNDGTPIRQGDEFLIPAIALNHIFYKQEMSVYNAGIKFAAEAALILYSGGSSLLITSLETTVLASQVVMEHYNGDIDAIEDPILKNRINAIRDFSDFVTLTAGLTDMAFNGVTRKPFFHKNVDDFNQVTYTFEKDEIGFALESMKKSGKLKQNVSLLDNLINKFDDASDITLQTAKKNLVSFKKSSEFYDLTKYSGDGYIHFDIFSGNPYFKYAPNPAYLSTTIKKELFDIQFEIDHVILSNIRWLPEGSSAVAKVHATLYKVKYENEAGQLVTKDLEIVENTSHQLYVRIRIPPPPTPAFNSNDILDDVLVLGDDLQSVSNWISTSDDYYDVVIHGNTNNTFSVLIEGVNYQWTAEKLALELKNVSQSKTIRLLSCNTKESAEELAEALERDIVYSEGGMKLYSNGHIETGDWKLANEYGVSSDHTYLDDSTPLGEFVLLRSYTVNELFGDYQNLISKLNEITDETIKQKFISDYGEAVAEVKQQFDQNTALVDSWKIVATHSDELSGNIDFVIMLHQDVSTPHLPNGTSATSEQIINSLSDPALFEFYKKFADKNYVQGELRKRYIETITLSDASDRILVLEDVLAWKQVIWNYMDNAGILTQGAKYGLSRGNLAFGSYSVQFNGTTILSGDYISMNGKKPTNGLLSNGTTNVNGHTIVPTNHQRLTGNTPTADRYFPASDGQWLDSESKLVEYLFEEIRIAKGINLDNGVKRKDLVNQIAQGVTLNVNIMSEMMPCSSCQTIISNVELLLPNSFTVSGGTLFHNVHN